MWEDALAIQPFEGTTCVIILHDGSRLAGRFCWDKSLNGYGFYMNGGVVPYNDVLWWKNIQNIEGPLVVKSSVPSMPFCLPVPRTLFKVDGYLGAEIVEWMDENIKGLWCSAFSYVQEECHVDFQHEQEMIMFKLRWIG